MKTLAEIFFDAIRADNSIMDIIDGRVTSTCYEIPPDEMDNTPIPNIIITDDGFQNNNSTKDDVWESDEDGVQATVDIAAESPFEVTRLVTKVRKAINDYITEMYEAGNEVPELQQGSPSSQGIQWDWMKPCYFQKISYSCLIHKKTDYE